MVAAIHEALHALAMLKWGKIPRSNVVFGYNWKAFMPYFHYKSAVTIRAYRIMALSPLLVLGPLSLVALAIFPFFWNSLISGFIISSCFSDVWIVIRLGRFDKKLYVQDHPTEVGCEIFKKVEGASS